MELSFIHHVLPLVHPNIRSSTIRKSHNSHFRYSCPNKIRRSNLIYSCTKNNNENAETNQNQNQNQNHNQLPNNSDQNQLEEYRRQEMIEEGKDNMLVWNDVIHASLKRKLQGLVAEKPVTNGVSALLHTSPATSSSSFTGTTTHYDNDEVIGKPDDVVAFLLKSFKTDALVGASAFVSVASDNCHVKHTNPETLVLFIGDNESYRPLLRLTSFYINPPRFEASGNQCVVGVEIHLPNVGQDESAKFDFQLSLNPNNGHWLIDELFRL